MKHSKMQTEDSHSTGRGITRRAPRSWRMAANRSVMTSVNVLPLCAVCGLDMELPA